jgi:hypothetical protein
VTLEDLADLNVGDDRFDTDTPVQRRRGQDESYEMTPYNPFGPRATMQTFDDRTFDRVVSVHRPKNITSGRVWFTEGEFIEVVSLTAWNKNEQRRFIKKFRRIQMQATGELNAKIVDTRQDRLMVEVLSQKGRKDVIEGGNINERESWITSRVQQEQTLSAPPMNKNKGFFGTLAEGLTGSK